MHNAALFGVAGKVSWQKKAPIQEGIMAKLLSVATQDAALKALGISSFAEVLDRDFLDLTPEHDADRTLVLRLYADRNRGSVRINSGHFYTASEIKARIRRVQELRLP